ncbi:hypothetical protein J6590_019044 [Homalodisca vitripennis]|nr:hypothetical protein J6590_019044 [Homalodisca vitripennis]
MTKPAVDENRKKDQHSYWPSHPKQNKSGRRHNFGGFRAVFDGCSQLQFCQEERRPELIWNFKDFEEHWPKILSQFESGNIDDS